jgi:hypothetical protein
MDLKLEGKAIEGSAREEYEDWILFHIRRERQWFEILRYLMQEDPCDLTAVLFDGVDKLQHLLWRFIDPAYAPAHPSLWEQNIRELCLNYFRQLDELLAEAIAMAGPDASVFLASDHGFGPSTEVFYLNTWLHQQGYLTWGADAQEDTSEAGRLGVGRISQTPSMIDWSRTTVYGHGQEALAEPLNNIPRTAFGTLAYVLGGASYVYLAGYDEAVSTPNENSARVALRTQQIIANEHGFADTIDPLGGSYYVETLTAQVESQILDGMAQIERVGGALAVISTGFGRRAMTEGAVRRQRAIDSGERPWVTVNMWPQKPDVPNTAFRGDAQATERQLRRLAHVKASRDQTRVRAALAEVDRAVAEDRNVVPSVLEAVRAYASVGEIVEIWRRRFGSFVPSTDF